MNFQSFIIFLLVLGLVLPSFSFAEEGVQPPETLEQARDVGLKILEGLPGAVKKVWQQEALPLWIAMWSKFQAFWDSTVWPRIAPWWTEKKPTLEQEFQKEKQEMKEDLPQTIKTSKSFWDRFKELLR